MKNNIICFMLLIAFISSSKAQEYESCFGKESTSIVIAAADSRWATEYLYNPVYYVIDSIQCYGNYNKDESKGVVFFETESNAKLWRWDFTNNSKTLFMDMNWNIGDTIPIQFDDFINSYPERPYAIVESVYYDENKRKVIQTDLKLSLYNIEFNLKYIEGIGPNTSIYFYDVYFWHQSSLLLCVYKDEIFNYSNTELDGECTFPRLDGVQFNNTFDEIDFTLNENSIKINMNDTFSGKLLIINSEGSVIKKVNINRNKKQVSINDIPSGVYIIQITDKRQQICQTKKITKTKIK